MHAYMVAIYGIHINKTLCIVDHELLVNSIKKYTNLVYIHNHVILTDVKF